MGRVSLERQFRMYRFYDEHGALLYVGITGRRPFRRLMEHVCDKPWAAEMARWEVDPGMWSTEEEVLIIERHTIRSERPRYNVRHNEGNPDRVFAPPVQRGTSPDRRTMPPAQRSVQRGGWGGRRPMGRVPYRRLPWYTRMSRTLTFRVSVLWLVLAGVFWAGAWYAARFLDQKDLVPALPLSSTAGVGALIATAILIRWWKRIRRKLKRRR